MKIHFLTLSDIKHLCPDFVVAVALAKYAAEVRPHICMYVNTFCSPKALWESVKKMLVFCAYLCNQVGS